jgi:hypothetical protein
MGSKKYEAATQSARHLVHHPDELDGVREDVWGQPQISIQMSRKSRPSFSQDEKVIYRTPLSSSFALLGTDLGMKKAVRDNGD